VVGRQQERGVVTPMLDVVFVLVTVVVFALLVAYVRGCAALQ
jgi:biopolymer transport protein ExbD